MKRGLGAMAVVIRSDYSVAGERAMATGKGVVFCFFSPNSHVDFQRHYIRYHKKKTKKIDLQHGQKKQN